MSRRDFFFAGGGTGGHIYPGLAVAEEIVRLGEGRAVHFFCSGRAIDSHIVGRAGFGYSELSARGFSLRPVRLIEFVRSFRESCRVSRRVLGGSENAVVTGVGGYVAAPVCRAARKLGLPVALLNVDIVAGLANRMAVRYADVVFVQFEETAKYFRKFKVDVRVVGCPLRSAFANPDGARAVEDLALDKDKRILLVTGASSGSESINRTICSLVDKLDRYAGEWQIVHLAGLANVEKVQARYKGAEIAYKVLGYYDEMADLLSAASLVVGRSGAVSVAEYAAAGVATICMPYPHHRDMHQYLNAGKLVEVGAAVIVDDLPDERERAEWLWEELEELMGDDAKRRCMAESCRSVGKGDAAAVVAEYLLSVGG